DPGGVDARGWAGRSGRGLLRPDLRGVLGHGLLPAAADVRRGHPRRYRQRLWRDGRQPADRPGLAVVHAVVSSGAAEPVGSAGADPGAAGAPARNLRQSGARRLGAGGRTWNSWTFSPTRYAEPSGPKQLSMHSPLSG